MSPISANPHGRQLTRSCWRSQALEPASESCQVAVYHCFVWLVGVGPNFVRLLSSRVMGSYLWRSFVARVTLVNLLPTNIEPRTFRYRRRGAKTLFRDECFLRRREHYWMASTSTAAIFFRASRQRGCGGLRFMPLRHSLCVASHAGGRR